MASTPGSERAARLVVATTALALLGAGCAHSHHHHGGGRPSDIHAETEQGGPPPWAPAHGHRRKHGHQHHHDHYDADGGVRVVFDSERGVYVVIGFPHHYYDAGHYYRVDGGRWQASAGFQGPWISLEAHAVPAPLRHAHEKPKKRKKYKRHKHGKPARYAD